MPGERPPPALQPRVWRAAPAAAAPGRAAPPRVRSQHAQCASDTPGPLPVHRSLCHRFTAGSCFRFRVGNIQTAEFGHEVQL